MPLWMLLRAADVLCCNHLNLLPAQAFTWNGLRTLTDERDPQLSAREHAQEETNRRYS